jgi:acyl-CoA synthetase (AMP-forming)/AMP-acid ligase II
MPLFHVHGLLGATLSTLSTGGTVVVPSRFSASTFWGLVHKYNVTWYSAVPTIHQVREGERRGRERRRERGRERKKEREREERRESRM